MFDWFKRKTHPEHLPIGDFIPEGRVYLENPKTGKRIPAPFAHHGTAIYTHDGEKWVKEGTEMDTPAQARAVAFDLAVRMMKQVASG